MAITIDYSLLPGFEKSRVYAPMISVTFLYKKEEFSTFALVDSGASGGLISTVIADELGIDWTKLPKKKGFGTAGEFIFHPCKIRTQMFNNEFTFTLDIVEGISPFRCILGRSDLFQKAKITFEQYNKQFHIVFRQLN